jgi:DNA-binding CsgD family transcriptional regulator
MGHKFHRGFTAAEKTELWDRWQRGESLKAIGRAFGKQSSSIYFLVAPHGGIRPAQRRRSRLALTLAEREVISRGVTAHQSARSIARLLGRSPSTASREMSRNGGCDRYRATLADENAWARTRRPKRCKLANSPRGGPFRNSRISRSIRGQPQHGAAEVVILGEVAIDCNTVDLVVADDRLNELITAMRNVGNPAS